MATGGARAAAGARRGRRRYRDRGREGESTACRDTGRVSWCRRRAWPCHDTGRVPRGWRRAWPGGAVAIGAGFPVSICPCRPRWVTMAAGAPEALALARELRAAVEADERQERENAAKLRALHQRVPSYEDFRNIVLASHLKPLEKKDKMGERRNVLWNPCAARGKAPQASDVEIPQELDQLPRTSAEFYRDWRRCLKSGKDKYQLLLKLGGEALGRIFQADLGFGLLGEFLVVLAENVCREDRDAVLQILRSLSGTKRFGLNVDLLSEPERESSRGLFGKLQRASGDGRMFPAGCGTDGETHLTDTSLQKETEERMLMELMKSYRVN